MSKTKSIIQQKNHVKTSTNTMTSGTSPVANNIELNHPKKTKRHVGTKRKNRKNITLAMKMEIIHRLEQGQSNSSICHEYNLPSSTVSTIRSKKEQIKEFCKNSSIQNQYYQISYPRSNIIEEVELALFKWIQDRNFQIETVRYNEVRDKALKFFEDAKSKQGMVDDKIDFKASHGWFDRFRKRFSKSTKAINSNNLINNNNKILIPKLTNGTTKFEPSLMFPTNDWIMVDTMFQPESSSNSNCCPSPLSVDEEEEEEALHSIEEPITVIEEENHEQIMTKTNFENDIMELFWGKVVSSIFANEKIINNNNNNSTNVKHLDAKTLALVFKLSEAIVHLLESRDPDKKRFLGFKQNLAHILHPYREIYNQELSHIKDSLKTVLCSSTTTTGTPAATGQKNIEPEIIEL